MAADRKYSISFAGTQSRTKQAFRDGTRIDSILKRYATLGVDAAVAPQLFAQGMAAAPFGVDLGRDYQAQLNACVAVQQYFERLPSRLRERFGNRAASFVEFVSDEANRDEAVKLGLVAAPPAPAAPPVPPVPPVPPAT